jgi:nucleoside-diphosphate-sugar epimerase
MHVALTGTTGRVGSRLLPRLVARGDTVRALARTPDAAAHVRALGAEAIVGDLRDASVRAALVRGVDAVLHVAALLRTGGEAEMYAVNVDATLGLADAAQAAGVRRFVFTSTQLVYSTGLGRPAVETDPTEPAEGWGAYPPTKAAAERALLARSGALRATIVRLGFVYGEGDAHLRESLRWAGRWPGHQRLHMIHHADVAQALIRVLEAPGVDGRIYNAADDAPMTAVELHQLAGAEPPCGEPADPAPDPWYGVMSTQRIRRELGLRPLYPSALAAADAGAL